MSRDQSTNPEAQRQAALESQIFAAELGGTAPEIDLHGMDVLDAVQEVERFLHAQFMQGERIMKIVHGRGSGTLRDAVQDFLKKNPLVEYFRDAQAPHSVMGVTYAVLVEKR